MERNLLLALLICFPKASQETWRETVSTILNMTAISSSTSTPSPIRQFNASRSLQSSGPRILDWTKTHTYPWVPAGTTSPVPLRERIIPQRSEHTELGVPNTLICFVNDLHPPVVEITWTRNGQPVDEGEVSQTQYYSNSDFSFRISSYLDFTPQEGDIYSCSVDHISLQAPLTRFWELAENTDHQAAETSVCVCGVILGLIGVVTGLWLIVKSNKSHRP
nr:PREDICTED: RLA class II histocompatibility antigen, DP alpha-1 chain-like isoform X4 [Paralichthys olivaceus]